MALPRKQFEIWLRRQLFEASHEYGYSAIINSFDYKSDSNFDLILSNNKYSELKGYISIIDYLSGKQILKVNYDSTVNFSPLLWDLENDGNLNLLLFGSNRIEDDFSSFIEFR